MKRKNLFIGMLLIGIIPLFLNSCENSEQALRKSIQAWSDATTTQNLQQLYLYTADGGEFADIVIKLTPEYENGKILQIKFKEIEMVVHSEWSSAQVECIMNIINPNRRMTEERVLITAEYIDGVWKLKRLTGPPQDI